MSRPTGLVGQTHLRSYISRDWELRVTLRCVIEDVGFPADARFEELRRHEIVRALVRERSDRTEGTRQVSPLTSGRKVWVLGHGHDHRGGTWFDEANEVVWLVAYRLHRSGTSEDFFPYCKMLDEHRRLFPQLEDYGELVKDRDQRFVYALLIQAPQVLKEARARAGAEVSTVLGGAETGVVVDVVETLEEITVAFDMRTLEPGLVEVILAAFHPGEWEDADKMPSRPLEYYELGFKHMH